MEAFIADPSRPVPSPLRPAAISSCAGVIRAPAPAAEAAGYVHEDAEPDLTADGLCRALSVRWVLAEAARDSFEHQTNLNSEHVGRMRMLWSVLRMWMEWAYAWDRWSEFHDEEVAAAE